MFYKIATVFVKSFFAVFFFLKSKGRENVPKEGGVLLCTNHCSNFDPPAIASAFPRKLSFMAKEELFENKLFAKLITSLGAFPIRRGKGDAGAVLAAIKILRSGGATLIFPEGTRVHNGDGERKINSGIIRIAIKARVPIVPGYTDGRYKLFAGPKIYFGEPIYYDEYYENAPDNETLERLSHELMEAIYSFAENH